MAVGPNQSVQRGCLCCCGCRECAGVGYWGQVTATITGAAYGPYNGTWTLTRSAGCSWSFNSGGLTVVFGYQDIGSGMKAVGSIIETPASPTLFENPTIDCLNQPALPSTNQVGIPATLTVTGVPGTWVSCGQNEDGVDIGDGLADEEVAPMMAVGTALRAPKQKGSSLSVARPDRCEHFTGPSRSSACSGWRRAGGCSKGLPAVPGGSCQTCEAYEADPDFAGRGTSGWLS